ncbi:Proteasome subunit beta type-4 [Cryomyces antarcticus]|nr:Proteasome subunit beta type-4 [Cryomyces antarcticus]KAK5139048.1 putative proteasome subunit beta type-4 [Oleoguttula sp. CCFEE 6159]
MRGATILKTSDDKTRALNKYTLMAFSGEAGDTGASTTIAFPPLPSTPTPLISLTTPADSILRTVQFAEYIQANIQLYSMRNDTHLGPPAVASFVRGELAKALRSRKPYNVNLLLGGYDPVRERPSLYWCDYLAALAPLPYAAHGYAQYYCLSILDKHHHPDISFEQGMKILHMCTDELKRRLPVDFKGMLVKVVTKDGIREEEYIDDQPVKAP